MLIVLLHGDAPFGWQGFVVCGLAVIALVIFFNEIARGALTKRNRKRRRYNKRLNAGAKARKPHKLFDD